MHIPQSMNTVHSSGHVFLVVDIGCFWIENLEHKTPKLLYRSQYHLSTRLSAD